MGSVLPHEITYRLFINTIKCAIAMLFLPTDSGSTLRLSLKMLTLWYKRLHYYGKSPCWMGKSTISMAIFNSYFELFWDNQRVTGTKPPFLMATKMSRSPSQWQYDRVWKVISLSHCFYPSNIPILNMLEPDTHAKSCHGLNFDYQDIIYIYIYNIHNCSHSNRTHTFLIHPSSDASAHVLSCFITHRKTTKQNIIHTYCYPSFSVFFHMFQSIFAQTSVHIYISMVRPSLPAVPHASLASLASLSRRTSWAPPPSPRPSHRRRGTRRRRSPRTWLPPRCCLATSMLVKPRNIPQTRTF